MVGRQLALAGRAVDEHVLEPLGQRPADQHQVDPHAPVVVEVAGPVVPVGEETVLLVAEAEGVLQAPVEEVRLDRDAHRGSHRIVPDHYGGRLRCTYTTQLGAEAAGSVRLAEGELKVGFPLVGGRVERAIVSGLAERARLEAELLDRWLDGRAG